MENPNQRYTCRYRLLVLHSDWDSLCVHDGRYDIELFNYDLFHPTPFTSCDDEDDSNGKLLVLGGSGRRSSRYMYTSIGLYIESVEIETVIQLSDSKPFCLACELRREVECRGKGKLEDMKILICAVSCLIG